MFNAKRRGCAALGTPIFRMHVCRRRRAAKILLPDVFVEGSATCREREQKVVGCRQHLLANVGTAALVCAVVFLSSLSDLISDESDQQVCTRARRSGNAAAAYLLAMSNACVHF